MSPRSLGLLLELKPSLLFPLSKHLAVCRSVLGLLLALLRVQLLEPAVEVSHDVLRTDVLREEFELSVDPMMVDQVERVLWVLTIALNISLAPALRNVQADDFDRVCLLVDQVDCLLDVSEATLANVLYVFELLLESTGIQEILKR